MKPSDAPVCSEPPAFQLCLRTSPTLILCLSSCSSSWFTTYTRVPTVLLSLFWRKPLEDESTELISLLPIRSHAVAMPFPRASLSLVILLLLVDTGFFLMLALKQMWCCFQRLCSSSSDRAHVTLDIC